LTSISAASAETPPSSFKPTYHPTLEVTRAPGAIKVDGDLSDPGWIGAKPATGFTEHYPGEEVEPPVRTRAFVTYDDDNLYLAAVCYAPKGTVRASVCEREEIFDDDNIGFFFDTYGDGARAYIINLNPYGIPYDALWSPNNGEDGNFDLVFASSGKVTDSGYQVEMAIPFRSLRFPNQPVQEWHFDFYRHHYREVHYSMSWAAYDLDESCWPCRWGTVTGIRDVRPGRGLELLGSYVAQQAGKVSNDTFPRESFGNGHIKGDPSIGGRYAITSDIVVEGTYNPDFSQIEADASQVDVNTTYALFYDEKRPFFQEALDIFQTNFFAVYTRTINNPDFAAKVSGKLGRTSFAALSAHDENTTAIVPFEEKSRIVARGKSFANFFAVRQSYGRDDHIRMVVTDRRYEGGGSGSIGSLDASLRLLKTVQARGQVIVSHTKEFGDPASVDSTDTATFDHGKYTEAFDGESFSGNAALVGVNFSTRRAYIGATAYQRTPTYRAENGFQPRNNDRWLVSSAQYNFKPQRTILQEISPGVEVTRIYNFDGLRKDEWLNLYMSTAFRFAQASMWTNWTVVSNERLGGIDFRELWNVYHEVNAQPWQAIGLGAGVSYGRQIARRDLRPGMQTQIQAYASIRPFKRLQSNWTLEWIRNRDVDTHKEYFRGYIARVKLNYQFTRRFSSRLVAEYDDFSKQWSVDPLLTYRINPFSTFYAGATYDYSRYLNTGITGDITTTALRQRQFFLKLQYLFQT